MNNLKKRIIFDFKNLKKKWLREKKFDSKSFFLVYSIKWYIVTLVRFLTKKKFDNDLNIFILTISILVSFFRNLLVKFIRYLDKYFPPYFGAIQTKITRKIKELGSSVSMSTSDEGIDMRMCVWKREALIILMETILKKKLKKIKFIEIGAASGIVSIMLAKWAKKNNIFFKAFCVEPNFSNVNFLQKTASKNNFDIRIFPVAVNQTQKWTAFEEVENYGTKGHVGDAILNKDNQIFKFSLPIKDIITAGFEPNIIYIDALLNESLILDKLLDENFSSASILVEFDYGVPNNIIDKCNDLNYHIKKIDNEHYLLLKNEDKID